MIRDGDSLAGASSDMVVRPGRSTIKCYIDWIHQTHMTISTQPSARENPDHCDYASVYVVETVAWLERVVIGLNLCPFAKAVHVKNQIRYVVSTAMAQDALCNTLVTELQFLAAADSAEIDTTLLIHPHLLTQFSDYNDFLVVADRARDSLDLTGVIQITSFHPQYQFANTAADDISNCTNRSPYPMLHLLRETSIDKAVAAFPDASTIFERNIETMNRLGASGWNNLTCKTPADR